MTKYNQISEKIYTINAFENVLVGLKKTNKKIVFTNGCFDILHLGHVDYLSKAADLGHILIIGLNSDFSVRKIKGATRPINDEKSRAALLASFFFVDAVVFFDEETPFKLIENIKPDVLVKGNDYKAEEIVGYDIVTENGGKVITLNFLEGYSTSIIERRIVELNNNKL